MVWKYDQNTLVPTPIITGESDGINIQIIEGLAEGEKVGIISTDATYGTYLADVVRSAGKREDEETIARELFHILREFDDEQVTVMYSESFDDKGIGQAIMNRLLKAAGHQVIQV